VIEPKEGNCYRVKIAYNLKEGSTNCPPLHNYEGPAYCQNVAVGGFICLLFLIMHEASQVVRAHILTQEGSVIIEDLGPGVPFLLNTQQGVDAEAFGGYQHQPAYTGKE